MECMGSLFSFFPFSRLFFSFLFSCVRARASCLFVTRSDVGGRGSLEARKYRGRDYGKTNTGIGMTKKLGPKSL